MYRVTNALHVIGLILVLSVVPAILALCVVAILDEYLATWMLGLLDMLQVNSRLFLAEASARWPELVGMLVGMALILALLWITRNHLTAETNNNH
jgi:hypothetical protein